MKKVLVFDEIAETAITYLKANDLEVISNKQNDDNDLIAHSDADGMILMMHPVSEKILSQMPKLKVIARYGVGYDNVNLDDADAHGIIVTNTPGANATAVAETAVMHMLMAGRSFYQQRLSITEDVNNIQIGQEVTNKTIGIIGFGAIGQKIDQLLTGFNVKVLAYARHNKVVKNGRMASLEEIYTQSDFVVLALPATSETNNMIDMAVFKKMKSNAVLVNIGRGTVIDEQALINALKSGEIAGAGLDVVAVEPISEDNELLSLPNVFVTPHVAAKSREAFDTVGLTAAEEVVRVLNGQAPRYQVN
ncbi:NAD(P)-dependent oxidoreductase [Leuconostoc gelidum]|uniref:Hydroxyacid dehydrogenase n=1 Tax=Leuconostoc gelidum subsp. gelidum TaxID=1607839 RepID=A0AB35FXJ3_LEUGE|nr:NAD(P)-dependent oxidoreductase [Leuconostoc gelidum]AFS40888.1 2-oxo-4-phenylbutanoate reductase [Leuconostoc gelidum JB7]MBZ5964123.1 hydroxyacid dehydrogenase [Leuconostoc gelidum subsp. gelidum]MBZ5975836.1 hydroxyacid dehydrogenase [Leuconostoc gelidum subsp. gelidum]MBZ5976685.1 hydroxyacid dehydrogenase [Leuconostoc gelidum subsp. gelidum]MBZ5986147.1 hydroxyacid dehydrogenase [Leuconostoc gelidum subsp. gelidum]